MKRFAINTLAAAALLTGGITLTRPATAAQNSAAAEPPASCGSCHCAPGQRCSKGWFGSCECY